jgi:perosamine synthetase
MISLATSKITKEVRDNIKSCLDDNRIAGGKFIEEFEKKTAKYLGVKHCIAVSSGTMADIVAMAVLKAKEPTKDEVIVPALTFVAQANSVIAAGLKPVFVDVDGNCQMNPQKAREAITAKTLAIFPANLLGKALDIEEISKIADEHNLYVVEDSCEAFGIPPFKHMATYSFFPSHTITTGEGGMIATDYDELAELARSIRNHGRKGDDVLNKFHFDYYGLNGKMSNLLASIGAALIHTAPEVIEKRKKNVELYNHLLEKDWYAASPHCYPVFYTFKSERDRKLIALEKNNIEARKLFSCLPVHEKCFSYLGFKPFDFPIAEKLGETALFVPVHQNLSEADIKKIVRFL